MARRINHHPTPRASRGSSNALANRWIWLLMIAGVLAAVAAWQRVYLDNSMYWAAHDYIFRLGGLGTYPVSVWTLLAAGALLARPVWLAQGWRWWIGSALLILAFMTVLGAIHGSDDILAEATLGGTAGHALWSGLPIPGALLALGTALLASLILLPKHTYRALAALLKFAGIALLALARLLGRGTVLAAKGIAAATVVLFTAIRSRNAEPAEEEATEESPAADAKPKAAKRNGVLGIKKPKTATPGQTENEAAAPQAKEVTRRPGQGWKLPPMTLYEKGFAAPVTKEETQQVAAAIEETLGEHGVEVTVDQINPGPTVTLYGVAPGWVRRTKEVKERDRSGNVLRDDHGRLIINTVEDQTRVKVDAVLAREKDLALALAVPSLRIQAPVPGEPVIGIEVPNRHPVLVTMRSVMDTPTFRDIVAKGGLPLALGQASKGDPVATDMRQLPHLLIAGATGSGKSVCINSLIVSLVSNIPPTKMRLLLIDPKRVEMTPYNGLPHLVAPVVVDSQNAVDALKGMLREMFRRYRRLEELGVRNIDGYHRHPQALEPMPYLVIAIDEMADLMMAAPYDMEQTICRLAQLGRATGIHIIAATQRPSVDVVTGLIKANFPSRISFAVVSQVDSRTILDAAGAERLLGKGDMLFLSQETPKPQRVQGTFVSDLEIGRLMEFWRSQQGPELPQFDLEPEPVEGYDDQKEGGQRGERQDDLLEKAIELAGQHSHISTSLLQRRLRIGYPRAARLMDQLEDEGIISAGGEPGKSRDVLRVADDGSVAPEHKDDTTQA